MLGANARLRRLVGSGTGAAAGLAVAVLATNLIAAIFTVVFARLLGASGYGSLAALVSAFLILSVPGQGLQVTVAREVGAAAAAGHPHPGAGVRHWLRQLAALTAVATVVSVLARDPIAAAIGVEQSWAAAAVLPSACLWLMLSVQRGALQGHRRYRWVGFSLVGEAFGRLCFGALGIAVGGDVTGAFLGTGFSVIAMCLLLVAPVAAITHASAGERIGRLRDMVVHGWGPLLALALIAALNQIDVILVKHVASDEAAGSWAATAVAAKVAFWVAFGVGLYLVPEVARRATTGADGRPILARTLAMIALVAAPAMLIYVFAGRLLLEVVYGPDLTLASDALPWLGLAMAFLACVYLAVQYLLALHRWTFILLLGVGLGVEVPVVLAIGSDLTSIGITLAALQLALASVLLTVAFRTSPRRAGSAAETPQEAPVGLAG